MSKQNFLYVLCTFLIVACGAPETKNTPEKGIGLDGEEVIMKDLPVQEFAPMPEDLLQTIKNNVGTIELEIISNPGMKTISESAEMAKILSFISAEGATLSRSCDIKVLVDINLQDTSRYHLEIFPEKSCEYVIVFEKTKAIHANKLTQEGVQYFQAAMKQD